MVSRTQARTIVVSLLAICTTGWLASCGSATEPRVGKVSVSETGAAGVPEHRSIREDVTRTRDARAAKTLSGDRFSLVDGRKIRLLGVAAPESGAPYEGESTDALGRLLAGATVQLVSDALVPDADSSGHLLRYAELENGTDVGSEMIRLGLARTRPEDGCTRAGTYEALLREAAKAQRGLWSNR
ncbi:thermonuclease family protein [Planctomycetota bacterium]